MKDTPPPPKKYPLGNLLPMHATGRNHTKSPVFTGDSVFELDVLGKVSGEKGIHIDI